MAVQFETTMKSVTANIRNISSQQSHNYLLKADYTLIMSHVMANFSESWNKSFFSTKDWGIDTKTDADAGTGTGTGAIIAEAVCQTFIMALSIIGNVLVILSLAMLNRLRAKKSNVIFVLSLASADLLVALCVMPFHIVQNVIGYWPFGTIFCTIFTANDVFFCTASLLGIICIAIERYVAVFKPLRYTSLMTTRVAVSMTCMAWVLSLLISYIPIYFKWHEMPESYEIGSPNNGTSDNIDNATLAIIAISDTLASMACGFIVNPTYAVISSLVSFWVPSVIMIYVYARMYIAAKRQLNALHHASSVTLSMTVKNSVSNTNIVTRFAKDRRYSSHRHSMERTSFLSSNRRNGSRPSITSQKRSSAYSDSKSPTPSRTTSAYSGNNLRTEVTLGRILGCFVICWFPFFTLLIIDSAILETPLDAEKFGWLFKSTLWLGYLNSTANPFIYALSNREFEPFWVHCKPECRNENRHWFCWCFNLGTTKSRMNSNGGVAKSTSTIHFNSSPSIVISASNSNNHFPVINNAKTMASINGSLNEDNNEERN